MKDAIQFLLILGAVASVVAVALLVKLWGT